MITEILIGLLVLTTLAAIGGIIGIINANKNMEAMKATNNALWEKYIAAEKDIEDTQRRSDLLKEKLKNVEALVGNTKLPIKVLRAQVITEIKK
ncbi:tail sheath monomer [Salmonella phage STG2]|uniref:Tail sheath monomer n=1 Tax=Salmonella phage STG2 TaxID=2480623 RepID=A0A3G2KAR0_9CAUD|nr:tail sheath monomer [Salmonella phage STG2]AYN56092.1 tail sheath monomer [Salmonella phage STG2]